MKNSSAFSIMNAPYATLRSALSKRYTWKRFPLTNWQTNSGSKNKRFKNWRMRNIAIRTWSSAYAITCPLRPLPTAPKWILKPLWMANQSNASFFSLFPYLLNTFFQCQWRYFWAGQRLRLLSACRRETHNFMGVPIILGKGILQWSLHKL